MTFWILLAVMSLVAVGFAVWPMYRHQRSLSPLIFASVIFVVALSSGLYYKQGNPDLPSGGASAGAGAPGMDDAINALAERLAANPDNPEGWQMLGRSYMSVGNYTGAVEAFEKAVALESAQKPQALVSLGEALLASTGSEVDGRVASLFENALALDPNNPQALFYGGIGAFNRGDTNLAADRWERLLSLNPPAEIQGILQQRIAEWRGEPSPAMPDPDAAAAESAAAAPAEAEIKEAGGPLSEGAVVRVNVSLSVEAIAALPAEATVFVIARDVTVPVPPIAAARRRLSELPTSVEIGDRESMVPGRELSTFSEFELIARVSLSGQPGAQPGDWFGAVIVTPADSNDVELQIEELVQ